VTTKTLLACGAIAGPLFVLASILEGATRAHYQPLRHPVSSLELGDFGWTQRANFLVAGGLTLAFAIGLRRALRPLGGSTWGPLLVGAHAIGLLGAGIFVTDPVSGYPPGTCRCPILGSGHATCAYSWISPPSRSRRTILAGGARTTGSPGPSGGACPNARCGRWPL
jgi:hypothetical protein